MVFQKARYINFMVMNNMPFAGFEDWDDCEKKMRKKYDEETAKKICGKLKAKYEGKK